MKYVNAFLSFPPSGPSLSIEPDQYKELLGYFDQNGISFTFRGIGASSEHHVLLLLEVGAPGEKERTMSLNSPSKDMRASWHGRTVEAFHDKLFSTVGKHFGPAPVKLWLERTRSVRLELPLADLPRPMSRARPSKPAALDPAPAAPAIPTTRVSITVAGRTMAFDLPMEEAFATSLEWTEKGYKATQPTNV